LGEDYVEVAVKRSSLEQMANYIRSSLREDKRAEFDKYWSDLMVAVTSGVEVFDVVDFIADMIDPKGFGLDERVVVEALRKHLPQDRNIDAYIYEALRRARKKIFRREA